MDLRKATNIWPSTNLEVNNETPTLDMGLVSQDYLPVSQNCRTPENEEIFAFQGDTLKTCSHNHSNAFLEGCCDLQSTGPCAPHDREQVKQRLYQSEHVEVKREPMNEVQMEPNSEIPQNLLEALGLDWDNEWYDNVADNTFMENGEMPQAIFASQEHTQETSGEFPIDVLSGVF